MLPSHGDSNSSHSDPRTPGTLALGRSEGACPRWAAGFPLLLPAGWGLSVPHVKEGRFTGATGPRRRSCWRGGRGGEPQVQVQAPDSGLLLGRTSRPLRVLAETSPRAPLPDLDSHLNPGQDPPGRGRSPLPRAPGPVSSSPAGCRPAGSWDRNCEGR